MEKRRRIPLYLRIKREHHRKIAGAQDVAVETLYSVFPQAVLHGGTAIWRCYSGNRFSEDLDVYLERNIGKIDRFFDILKKRNFEILKRRVKKNALYSVLRLDKAEIRFEAVFKKLRGILREYETSEGNLLTVYTLGPEDLLGEKVEAYLARRKVRDLYDVFFLLRLVERSKEVKFKILKLLKEFRLPVDERELRATILFGAVPNVQGMLEYIRRWVR